MGRLRGLKGRCPCLDICRRLGLCFAFGYGPCGLTGQGATAVIGAIPTALIGCHQLRYITTTGP